MEEVKKLKNKASREHRLGEVDTYLVKMEGLGEWEGWRGERPGTMQHQIGKELLEAVWILAPGKWFTLEGGGKVNHQILQLSFYK